MAKTPKIAGAPEFGKYIAPEESVGKRLEGKRILLTGTTKGVGKIAQAPFYAIPLATGTMGSAGGIRVNGDMQVLNADYEPIPGLYAVGLDATGLYGDSYNMEVPGAANGFAHTSGRIAARHAIAQMD